MSSKFLGSQAPQAFFSPEEPIEKFLFYFFLVVVASCFFSACICAELALEPAACLGPAGPVLLARRSSCVASSWAVASVYASAFVAAPLCDVSQLCAEHIERGQPLEPLLSGGLWFPLWYAVTVAVMP